MNLRRARDFAVSTTGRLAASYLLVIMIMSLGFSVVLYAASSNALQHQVPPQTWLEDIRHADNPGGGHPVSPRFDEFFQQRVAEGQRLILVRLSMLNLATLILGAMLSYYLARRTLKPIEDNFEAQSQFVSDASHELRTPLTTIRTSNEVALRNAALTLPQAKSLLRENLDEAGKLQELTDGLLKLARGESAMLETTPVPLQDAANEAMNRVLKLAQRNDVSIDDAVPDLKVMADHASLVQVIVILLDNAVKYSPSGSSIAMKAIKRGRTVEFQVRDQGPGIRPYDLRRIFDRFYRADQSRSGRHVAGHGIGLSLAKKLVSQQGGEIKAASTVGKGSVFSFILRIA